MMRMTERLKKLEGFSAWQRPVSVPDDATLITSDPVAQSLQERSEQLNEQSLDIYKAQLIEHGDQMAALECTFAPERMREMQEVARARLRRLDELRAEYR